MKRIILMAILLVPFFSVSVAAANKSYPGAGGRHIQMVNTDESQDQSMVLWGYIFSMESTEVKKVKPEEDGRHFVFHFERIRKMRRGFSLCCLILKLLLGTVHTALMLQMFLHLSNHIR